VTGRPRSARADAAILDAAVDELVEHGFTSMTIERIAARAGVARTTVYRRWSGTAELCMDALDRIREPVPTPPGGSVRDDLVFLLRYVNRLLTRTRFGAILPQLAAEARRHPEITQRYWAEHFSADRSVAGEVIRRGIDQRLIRADADIELVIDTLIGPLLHRSMWGVATVTDDQITRIVETVLAGLAPPAGRPG